MQLCQPMFLRFGEDADAIQDLPMAAMLTPLNIIHSP